MSRAKLKCHVRDVFSANFISLKNEISVPDGLNDQILDSIETIDRRPIIVRRQRSKVAGFCALGVALAWIGSTRPPSHSPGKLKKVQTGLRKETPSPLLSYHCLIVRKFLPLRAVAQFGRAPVSKTEGCVQVPPALLRCCPQQPHTLNSSTDPNSWQ